MLTHESTVFVMTVRACASALFSSALVIVIAAPGHASDTVEVRHAEGLLHGFLVLPSLDVARLAD